MSTMTKLAYDKTIAEMHNSRIHQTKRIELTIDPTPSPPLRTDLNAPSSLRSDSTPSSSLQNSGGNLLSDLGSDTDSDGSFGSFGNRNSFMTEENSSPSAVGLGYAFMSARGSRILLEEDLAKISDMPLDEAPSSPHIVSLQDRNASTRSPSLKRSEYFAKIKNEFTLVIPSTPPPNPPCSPPDESELVKRLTRSAALSMSSDTINLESRKDKKEKEKEKVKEEKVKKKQERKDSKAKAKAISDPPSIAGAENSRIMQHLLGAMRPKSLANRGGSVEFDRPIDSSSPISPKDNPLRRSTSFKELDLDATRSIPKYAKILGSPVMDFDFAGMDDDRSNWRKSKMVKNVLSDPFPVAPSLLPPPPPPPTSISEHEPSEDQAKQKKAGRNGTLTENSVETTDSSGNDEVDEEGIVFHEVREQSGHKQVKGATLKKLVERLTCESISDTNFLLQFIITYRSFTNPHDLLELLKVRFESGIEISPDANDAQREILNKKQLIVRLRVYNVIRQWIDKQWMDFLEDNTLVEKMISCAPMLNEVVSQKSSNSNITKIIEKKMAEGEKQKKIMFSKQPPDPHIPSVPREKIRLLDIHPEEIARQMTLMEYSMFAAIKPWEYLCWNTKMKQTKSGNILAMINKFNTMSKWVQKEVLTAGETPKARAAVIGKFLEICEHLRALKNYNGIMEILSGLNASSVHRLKLTWACLSSKQTDVFQDINELTTGNNYKNLRTALHTLQPPCIPYLGMYLTDLTFINDGIPLYLPDSVLINFDKCRKASASVIEIMQYQQTPFCLQPVDDIQSYLAQLEEKLNEKEDDFYKISLVLEERKG